MANDLWLKINRARNGYVLERGGEPFSIVIEEDENDDLKEHEELLWEVMEYFDFQGTKHNKERLKVVRTENDD
ncbi:hypothetical protein A2Z67_04775 [Candidatus Woesebacteria bacterium RBG_13_36_22]|uniref:Uncharacterized protein n=1 Tax=Candidatus Woesebacteria bacterium RBG_13_36_22 TaxID=1802478 RepID=A0A1F7X2A3_9BACT|nr:MAG: hypothetical protein A2Z67_04775 [Candidatus Woesebacteria bacterium RBG_13_36_22]